MRIVCLSDTHQFHERVAVPDGDLLLHAGDFSGSGNLRDVETFDRWLASLPHPHKVVIAGNHDFAFERQPQSARHRLKHARYLQDEAFDLKGFKIYGSPWTPWFYDWAFNLERGEPLRRKWARIPQDVDILITHGPPAGILDMTDRGVAAGCEDLAERLATVKPRLHLFGHIHEAYGTYEQHGTLYLNASICDARYQPSNAPFTVDLPPRSR